MRPREGLAMSSAPTDVRLQVSVPQPWIARMSRIRRVLISLTATASIFFCGGILDWLIAHQYLPQLSLMIAGAIISLAAGLLILKTLAEIQKRYQTLVERLLRIAELNQHIRDALQVIVFTNVPERTAEAIRKVNAAVMRIESVLREEAAGSRCFVGRFE
jgi:hypothetical protein